MSPTREYRFIYWQNNPIAWKLYRDEKEVEYEEKYRKNYTLGLLRKCGLDIAVF